MKTLITLTLTAAEGGDNGVKIPADGIAIFDPKNGQVNADGDLVSGDRVKATVTDGVLLDAEGNDGVWLEPGQYWASVTSVTSRVTKYVEVPESDAPILLTSLFELEAVPGWRLTEGVVNEVKQARDEAVAAAESGGANPELIEQTVTDLLSSGDIELPPGEQGPEGPRGPEGPQGPPGQDGQDGAEGPQGERGPEGPQGIQGPPGVDGAPGEDGAEGPRGLQGIQGEPGSDGAPGADGKSAYQIALDEGFVGDEAAFLDSLVGPEGPQGPAGEDGAEGPRGEKGDPGEIPDLLVSNITDATPTGKNLMLAATEGAARNALGLQAGATAISGAASELKPGSTQTTSRVWSPKTISDYVELSSSASESRVLRQVMARPSASVTYGSINGLKYTHLVVTDTPAPGIAVNHYVEQPSIGEAPAVDTLRSMLGKVGGTVLFNSHGFGTTRVWGPAILRGVAYQEIQSGSRGSEVLGFFADGTTKKYYGARGDTVAQMVSEGVQECFSFGCFLVEDGVPRDVDNDPVFGDFATISARQILGVTDSGQVMLTTVEGVSGSSGLTGTETANLAHSLGYFDAVMLDGGGSAQTSVNGNVIMPSSDTQERAVAAFGELRVAVGKVSTGWNDLPLNAGVEAYSAGRTPRVKKEDGRVSLAGAIKQTSGPFAAMTWRTVCVLPKDYLHDYEGPIYPPAVGPNGEGVIVSLSTSGSLQVKPLVDVSVIDLSGVSFDAKY